MNNKTEIYVIQDKTKETEFRKKIENKYGFERALEQQGILHKNLN